MSTPAINVAQLEPILQEMVGLVGLAHTLTIVEHWGGLRLYVPKEVGEDHALAKLIGIEGARRLAEAFGDDRWPIPKALRALRAVRDHHIVTNPDGLSVYELVRRFGLTERQIYKIRARAERTEHPTTRLHNPAQTLMFSELQ